MRKKIDICFLWFSFASHTIDQVKEGGLLEVYILLTESEYIPNPCESVTVQTNGFTVS